MTHQLPKSSFGTANLIFRYLESRQSQLLDAMQVLASSCSQLAGTQLQTRTQIKRANRSASLACRASSDQSTRRQLLSFGALFAAASVVPGAKADLVADLLSKSATNKALHDRQRLATSGANFHNSRTIADGTCAFPKNLFGCGNHVVAGDVKFISDDIKIECEVGTNAFACHLPYCSTTSLPLLYYCKIPALFKNELISSKALLRTYGIHSMYHSYTSNSKGTWHV